MRLRQLAVVTPAMAAMLLLGVHPALSQQRDSDKSITITYSGFGIYQHPERVTLYDWRNVKNWVYPELPPEARIALPQPSRLPKTPAERALLSAEIGAQLATLIKDRLPTVGAQFEIQTLQKAGLLGYALQGFGMRKDLVQWQKITIDALNIAKAELSRDYHVHIHAVMGSNDAHTFAQAIEHLTSNPFESALTDDGRAFVNESRRMADSIHGPVTFVNTHGDILAMPWMVAHRSGAEDVFETCPNVRLILLSTGHFLPGAGHVSLEIGRDTVRRATLTDASGTREITGGRDAILKEARRPLSGTRAAAGSRNAGVDLSEIRLTFVSSAASGKAASTMPASVLAGPLTKSCPDPRQLADRIGWCRRIFLVGLAVPPDRFWVNLNPTEPNRICDPLLAKTDVARVLLEADLRMKQDAARITDPRTSALGREYWRRLSETAGKANVIRQQNRFWIVPGSVELLSDGNDALITYADLTVKLETEYFAARGGHADRSRSEAVTAELVLPALEDLVNDGPGYEDLRSVYHALILARWYRQRFPGTNVPGASTIDSCDVSTLGGQPGWTPEGVWQRYMRSLRQGEYDFTTTSRERRGNLLITRTERYMSGGVDFSNIPTVTAGRIDPMYASLVQSAFSRRGGALQGRWLWFADSDSAARPLSAALTTGGRPARGSAPADGSNDGSVAVGIAAALIAIVLAVVYMRARRRPFG